MTQHKMFWKKKKRDKGKRENAQLQQKKNPKYKISARAHTQAHIRVRNTLLYCIQYESFVHMNK